MEHMVTAPFSINSDSLLPGRFLFDLHTVLVFESFTSQIVYVVYFPYAQITELRQSKLSDPDLELYQIGWFLKFSVLAWDAPKCPNQRRITQVNLLTLFSPRLPPPNSTSGIRGGQEYPFAKLINWECLEGRTPKFSFELIIGKL